MVREWYDRERGHEYDITTPTLILFEQYMLFGTQLVVW